jgi:predicted DNA-binding transcriptional regulator YafY
MIPFADPRELAGDIMRWGEFVKVVEPAHLRKYVANALKNNMLQYEDEITAW